jgi:hypothetical protein
MQGAKRGSFERRPARLAALPVVLTLALASGTLFAGGNATLKGKVVGWDKLMPAAYAEASKNGSTRFTWRDPSPTVKSDFRKLTANVSRDVCVAAFGGGASSPHDSQRVFVTGERTNPTTIVLSPGSRLSFKNSDPFPHSLYEVGNASWSANPTAPGSSRDWAAGAAGLHVVRDMLFPSLVMYIVVDASAVESTFPDRDGLFAMNLPPGEYTLKTFFDGKPVGKVIDGVKVGEKDLEIKDPMQVGDTK